MKTKFFSIIMLLFVMVIGTGNGYAADWIAQTDSWNDINCIGGTENNEIYAVGTAFLYNVSGSWVTKNPPNAKIMTSVLPFDSSNVYFAGNSFLFGKYNTSTDSYDFSYTSDTSYGTINSIWGTDASHVYGCTNKGMVYHLILSKNPSTGQVTNNATSLNISTSSILNCMDGKSATEMYVVGTNGFAARYNGSTWSYFSNPDAPTLNFFKCKLYNNHLYVVTQQTGQIFDYNTTTHAWVGEIEAPEAASGIHALWISDNGIMFIGDAKGDIYKTSLSNINWERMTKDEDSLYMNAIWGYSSDYVFSGTRHYGSQYKAVVYKYGEAEPEESTASFVIPWVSGDENDETHTSDTAIIIFNQGDSNVSQVTCSVYDTEGNVITDLDISDFIPDTNMPTQTLLDQLTGKNRSLFWASHFLETINSNGELITSPFSVKFTLKNISNNDFFPYVQYRDPKGQFIVPSYKSDATTGATSGKFVTPYIDAGGDSVSSDSFLAVVNMSSSDASVTAKGYPGGGATRTAEISSFGRARLTMIPLNELFSSSSVFTYGGFGMDITGGVDNIFGCIVQKRGGNEIGYRAVPLYRNLSTTTSSFNYFQ